MKELPADFDGHPLARTEDNDCFTCFFWDEPAWYWHAEIPPPGTAAEALARFRESLRLAGLEFLNLAARTAGELQRWLRGLR